MMIKVDSMPTTVAILNELLTRMEQLPEGTDIQEYQNSDEYLARQLL